MKPKPALRPAVPADQEFLFQLYAATRRQEIAAFGWNAAQQDAFLRMQFKAQQQWYATAYADADHQIVMLDDQAVGRTLVQRKPEAATLVDIALLPDYRGRGLGESLLRDLLEACRAAQVPMRLQVLKTNPAQRLYERLGFRSTGEDQMYLQMEWRGDDSPISQSSR